MQELVRDVGSIPGFRRFPGGRHGNPLQYSCLENPMDRGAWKAAVHRATQSQTRLKQLSMKHARTAVHQAPLSVEFSRQEWVALPPPGDLPPPGTEPMSPALSGGLYHRATSGSQIWVCISSPWRIALPSPSFQFSRFSLGPKDVRFEQFPRWYEAIGPGTVLYLFWSATNKYFFLPKEPMLL